MSQEPDIIIGHHPEFGVAAVSRRPDSQLEQALLSQGFRRLPDRWAYSLDGTDRGSIEDVRSAVAQLRKQGFNVTADRMYEGG
ncbi:hypothetical protein AB0L14_28330 [Streptomyces sp. NPDC052727]|uniref:hypothetical protein n=1 Tax=Streptomyces sp. NPDC052727 TaxID=3154854 RepID=UPI00342DBE59